MPASRAARSPEPLRCWAGVDLLRHQLVVARLLHLPEDADRGVPEVRRVQPGQRERVGRVRAVRVVGDQRASRVVRAAAPCDLDRLELAVRAEAQAAGRRAAEPDRLAVLEPDQPLVAVALASLSGSNASSLKMLQFW